MYSKVSKYIQLVSFLPLSLPPVTCTECVKCCTGILLVLFEPEQLILYSVTLIPQRKVTYNTANSTEI
jgi:hypothetical protein